MSVAAIAIGLNTEGQPTRTGNSGRQGTLHAIPRRGCPFDPLRPSSAVGLSPRGWYLSSFSTRFCSSTDARASPRRPLSATGREVVSNAVAVVHLVRAPPGIALPRDSSHEIPPLLNCS